MDTSQWPQGIGVVMEGGGARRARPEKDEALNCPRCNSTNTKFCYYNNYSLSQPRYFCKTCRRYWTNGGSLRNVPVGGGSRKNKRSSSSTPAAGDHDHHNSSSKIKLDDHNNHVAPLGPPNGQNPSKVQYQGQDLNLAYPHQDHFMSKFVVENMPQYLQNPSTTNTATTTTPAMEVLKMSSPFVSMGGSGGLYDNGFSALQGVKGTGGLSFSLEGMEHGNGARVLFPFEDVSVRGQGDSTAAAGYWSGMLGGDHGGSW